MLILNWWPYWLLLKLTAAKRIHSVPGDVPKVVSTPYPENRVVTQGRRATSKTNENQQKSANSAKISELKGPQTLLQPPRDPGELHKLYKIAQKHQSGDMTL